MRTQWNAAFYKPPGFKPRKKIDNERLLSAIGEGINTLGLLAKHFGCCEPLVRKACAHLRKSGHIQAVRSGVGPQLIWSLT